MSLFIASYLGEWLEYLIGWFTRFHYTAPFVVLLLCGLGAPLPEEVTLIGCGYLCQRGIVEFLPITLVCSSAILLGDSIPYWLGRYWGLAALRSKWVAKVLHPERFAKLERRFEDNKNWSIFTCRFLPGLRIPGYFVAGTMRMSYTRFLLLDGLGVLVSVPTSIWVAKIVFEKIGDLDQVQAKVSEFNHILLAAVAAAVVGYLLWRRWRKRTAATAAAAESTPPPTP